MKPHLRIVRTNETLEDRLDRALDNEIQEVRADTSDLAELINRFLSALDQPRAHVTETDEYGLDERLAKRARALAQLIFRIEGEVPREGAAVLVPERLGWLLGLLIEERRVRPLVDLSRPYLGTLLNRIGCVSACHENALRLLGEGRVLVMERDFGRAAIAHGAPVLPVRLEGLTFIIGAPVKAADPIALQDLVPHSL